MDYPNDWNMRYENAFQFVISSYGNIKLNKNDLQHLANELTAYLNTKLNLKSGLTYLQPFEVNPICGQVWDYAKDSNEPELEVTL